MECVRRESFPYPPVYTSCWQSLRGCAESLPAPVHAVHNYRPAPAVAGTRRHSKRSAIGSAGLLSSHCRDGVCKKRVVPIPPSLHLLLAIPARLCGIAPCSCSCGTTTDPHPLSQVRADIQPGQDAQPQPYRIAPLGGLWTVVCRWVISYVLTPSLPLRMRRRPTSASRGMSGRWCPKCQPTGGPWCRRRDSNPHTLAGTTS